MFSTCAPRADDEAAASTKRAPPNVLFVCIDTLRADHLGFHGYERPTSPHLDAVAAQGVRFTRCISGYPQTVASVATLMTGLYPSAHGMLSMASRIPREAETLAELFHDAGYATCGVVTNPHLGPGGGYEQGFEQYTYLTGSQDPNAAPEEEARIIGDGVEHRVVKGRYPQGPEANAAALEWLLRPRSIPYFAYVHYMDVHAPYEAPAEFREHFVQNPAQVIYTKGRPKRPIAPEDLEYTKAVYDGQILYMDTVLQRLLDELESAGLMENTILVVTADHGEEFMDHGGIGHGTSLYRELLHVPLVIRGPGIEPREIGSLVSTVDIAPTVCELAGIDSAPRRQGFSLVPWIEGEPSFEREPAVWSERKRGPGKSAWSVSRPDWRFLAWSGTKKTELFDMRSDPLEREDVSKLHPDVLAEMSELAERFQAEMDTFHWEDEGPRTIDQKTSELLRAIGYDGE